MKYEVLVEKNSYDIMGVATIIERKLRVRKYGCLPYPVVP